MTFHVLAFNKANLPVGSTYVELVPVNDSVIPMKNPGATQRAWLSEDAFVFAAWAGATSLSRARFFTGWLAPSHIRPVGSQQTGTTDPAFGQWLDNPVKVPAMQEMTVEAVHSSVSVQNTTALLFLSRGLSDPPKGPVLPLRATSTTAAVANTWTEVALTWEYALTAGKYAVVGSECISTAPIAHRWIFDNAVFRPGGLSTANEYQRTWTYGYGGVLGTWGTFMAPVMPRLEVLCPSTDASHVAYLQVVPLF